MTSRRASALIISVQVLMVPFPVSASACPASDAESADNMRYVAGAKFRMGSDADDLERVQRQTGLRSIEPLLSEVPSHQVTARSFCMDKFSVTNGDFARFVEANPAWGKSMLDSPLQNGRYLEHWSESGPLDELMDHPVTFVTWQAAVQYCRWQGKRLPTEIEYEWASQDGAGSEFPWGDSPPNDDIVSWGGNGIDTTVPVGSYPPNSRDLYDMSGNVWHFTSDPWLGSYEEMLRSADERPDSEDPGIRRVVRGGSWGANSANLRVRYRDSHRPYDAREMVGFRCALSVPDTAVP